MSESPRLTIGMAQFEDFDGVYFTIQALRMFHPHIMEQAEIIVIDNSPESQTARLITNLVERAGGRYIPMATPKGTSPSRDRIFKEARGDIVMVMDCHILVATGGLDALLAYHDERPDNKDIVSGPLLYDTLDTVSTHYNDEWRQEMWGTWGTAWQCKCGSEGVIFSLIQSIQEAGPSITSPVFLVPGAVPAKSCHKCQQLIPTFPWVRHEDQYQMEGYNLIGLDPDFDTPFATPGHGLGLFSCRREIWPGFNEHARGFGGEELYIHGKIRANGGASVCIPKLKWLHRFARAHGVKYPLTRWNKVRNYVLEFTEMGWPLDSVYEHFVGADLLSQEHWDHLVEDPIGNELEPGGGGGCGGCGPGGEATKQFEHITSIEDAYKFAAETPRDLNEHVPRLRELASKVDRVTEFSERRESMIAFLAAKPKSLISYNTEVDGLVGRLSELYQSGELLNGDCQFRQNRVSSSQVAEIDETDLLFLDQDHTANALYRELDLFAPKTTRYIVLHDTQIHGEKGSDGGPGLWTALGRYMKANPEWSVIEHTPNQYGLTVLSRVAEDKPELPPKIEMAKNLAGAISSYVVGGAINTNLEDYEARLERCTVCEQRTDNRCAACGCFLDKKAAMKNQNCPLGRWPVLVSD